MTKRSKLSVLALSAIMVLVLSLGVSAAFAQSDDATPDSETPLPERPQRQRGFPGQAGPPEGVTDKAQLLADALNIDLETLEAAQESARAAAIDQALAEGLITEEQAEMLREGSFGPRRGRGFHGFGDALDHEALLADALNISVEELQAAKEEAHEAALAELVEAGYLTEEDVELMVARQALKDAIDRQVLLAEVLDISQAELEEALASREAMAALIEDSGLSRQEFAEAMQAAHEAAVEQAVEDGVITAEQYEALQEAGPANGRGFGGPGRGFGGPGRGGHGCQGQGRPGGFGGNGAFRGGPGQPGAAPATAGASI